MKSECGKGTNLSKLVQTSTWKLSRSKGAKAIKALLEQRGVDQKDLAEATGVSKTGINKLTLGGTEKPSFELIRRVYGSLGLSLEQAAHDFGMPGESTTPIPELEQIRAILRAFEDCPEIKSKLVEELTRYAQVFEQQHQCVSV